MDVKYYSPLCIQDDNCTCIQHPAVEMTEAARSETMNKNRRGFLFFFFVFGGNREPNIGGPGEFDDTRRGRRRLQENNIGAREVFAARREAFERLSDRHSYATRTDNKIKYHLYGSDFFFFFF